MGAALTNAAIDASRFQRPRRRWVLGSVAGVCALVGSGAWGVLPEDDDDAEMLTARLIAEHAHAVPGGVFHIALHMSMVEGWHTYWDGLNDTGFAPTIKLTLPEGWEAGAIQWPAPERYVTAGGLGLDHVYHRDTALIIPITVPANAKPGERGMIVADAEWLVCKEACIPGWATLELSVDVETGSPVETPEAGLFRAARALHPRPWSEASSDGVSGAFDASEGVLTIRADRANRIAFYPSSRSATPVDVMNHAETTGGRLRLAFTPRSLAEKPINGIVAVWTPAQGETPARVRWYALESSQSLGGG